MNTLQKNTDERLVGGAFALGSILLFVAWWLMPDAGTADAAHILEAVGATRDRVAASALVQIVACVLLAPGLVFVARSASRRTAWSTVALAVGVIGMAMDAVYHQLAVEMTASGLDRSAMLAPMTAMQTRDIRSLAPLMLMFVIGGPVFVFALRREGHVSRLAALLSASAPVMLVLIGVAAAAHLVPKGYVALGVLAAVCGSLAVVGIEMGKKTSPP